MEDENVHKGHRERMITKLEEQGIEAFESHELLEMLLYSSIKRGNTNPTAHNLMATFGTLTDVIFAKKEELLQVEGVGNATAQMLLTTQSVLMRMMEESAKKGQKLAGSKSMMDYCNLLFRFVTTEQVRMIFLDNNFRFVTQRIVSSGAIEKVTPDMFELIQRAAARRCPVAVLAHNHPRGSELPSSEDKTFTRMLYNLLERTGIFLADHIIVGAIGTLSMRETNMMPDIWSDG